MAWRKKPHKTSARRLGMVCVHPAGHSSIDPVWDPCPAGSAVKFSGSSSIFSSEVSVSLYPHLFWGWAAGRGNRMARLRSAAHAIPLWRIAGHSAPGCLVDILAPGGLPYRVTGGRARHWFICLLLQFTYFFPAGYGPGDHYDLGLQPYSGEHFHCDFAACQL